jgi:hypothetical protein
VRLERILLRARARKAMRTIDIRSMKTPIESFNH